MRLKSERRVLSYATGAIAAVAVVLGALPWQESTTPPVAQLGTGLASVEAQRVSDVEPLPTSALETEPKPAASESPMADGEASFYGSELAGNSTASGEIFDPDRLTAAHRTLPLGSKVRVTNPQNGRSVVVRVNDRGPYHGNRVIDLSAAAARNIGLIQSGTERVKLSLLLG